MTPQPPSPSAAPIAAFDFDGTLTVRDSFTAFLRWRKGAAGYALGVLRLAPALAAYALHRDRGRLKAAAVRVFLKGVARAALEREARAFAAETVESLLRPDAVTEWRRLQAAGVRLVIVTASPETVVAPFARGLGADLLIGTRLRFTADDRVEGGFDGSNCRGPEKVRRLEAALGDDVELLAAYGDTAGDREMLARAREPHMRVFTGRPPR